MIAIAAHLTGEDRVPAFQELGVRNLDTERGAQARKELRVADLAPLVTMPGIVRRKPRDELCRFASRVCGPGGEHSAEIDIEHDAAEIEQQRVGGIGGEMGVHALRLQNHRRLGNAGQCRGVTGLKTGAIQPLSRRASCAKRLAGMSRE